MKHAGSEALDRLDGLLARLRERTALRERSRGIFHLKGSAFLHFHEDPAGLFADLKVDRDFARFRVTTAKEREALLRAVDARISPLSPAAPRPARSPGTRRGA